MLGTKNANQNQKQCTSLPPSKIPLINAKKTPNEKCIHFMDQFKYLGSFISPELNKDTETVTRSKKRKSIIGNLIPLIWGCETWNLAARNLRILEVFHYGAARRILNIKWQQVHEDKIRSKQVRCRFCSTPKVEIFII
jgi:hypothetical protein